jgi:hypothetical protein
MHSRLESLHQIDGAIWRELGRAAHDRRHDWHVLVLATVDGQRADARSVVVRDVHEESRSIVFYADDRSPKLAQIAAHPHGTLVGWSARSSWQVRLRVTLQASSEGLDVSSRWARVKLSPSVHDYLAALPPGTPVDSFEPERASREHFAVVTASVDAIDWLELHVDGHRRARLAGRDSSWLSP